MADVNQELERHIGEDTQISLVDTQTASWRRRQESSPGGRVGKEAEEETARAKVGLRDSCRRIAGGRKRTDHPLITGVCRQSWSFL